MTTSGAKPKRDLVKVELLFDRQSFQFFIREPGGMVRQVRMCTIAPDVIMARTKPKYVPPSKRGASAKRTITKKKVEISPSFVPVRRRKKKKKKK